MASHEQVLYGLTLVNNVDSESIMTKNLFKLPYSKDSLSDLDDAEIATKNAVLAAKAG